MKTEIKGKILVFIFMSVIWLGIVSILYNYTNISGRYNPKLFPAEHFNKNISMKLHSSDTVSFVASNKFIGMHKVNKRCVGMPEVLDSSEFNPYRASVFDTVNLVFYHTFPVINHPPKFINVIERPKLTLKICDTIITKCDTLVILRYE